MASSVLKENMPNMYYKALLKQCLGTKSSLHIPNELNKDFFDDVCQLSRSQGRLSAIVESSFLSIANDVLFDAWGRFDSLSATDGSGYLLVQKNIDMLISISKEFAAHKTAQSIIFASCRVKALGYSRLSDWPSVVKVLNIALSTSSQETDGREIGFSDALILLSEAYTNLGSYEDAMRSARLAVSLSHELIERHQKSNNDENSAIASYNQFLHNNSNSFMPEIGPILPPSVSLAISYHELAKQLDARNLTHLSVEWHQRALNVALKHEFDEEIVKVLKACVDVAIAPRPKKTGRNGVVNRSMDIESTEFDKDTSNIMIANHRVFGASKSMDDTELAKQLNHIYNRQQQEERMKQPQPPSEPYFSEIVNTTMIPFANSSNDVNRSSSSISDDAKERQPEDHSSTMQHRQDYVSRHNDQIPAQISTGGIFTDSFVETVDLNPHSRANQYQSKRNFSNNNRPFSARPRMTSDSGNSGNVRSTVVSSTMDNASAVGMGDIDSLTMESGMIGLNAYPINSGKSSEGGMLQDQIDLLEPDGYDRLPMDSSNDMYAANADFELDNNMNVGSGAGIGISYGAYQQQSDGGRYMGGTLPYVSNYPTAISSSLDSPAMGIYPHQHPYLSNWNNNIVGNDSLAPVENSFSNSAPVSRMGNSYAGYSASNPLSGQQNQNAWGISSGIGFGIATNGHHPTSAVGSNSLPPTMSPPVPAYPFSNVHNAYQMATTASRTENYHNTPAPPTISHPVEYAKLKKYEQLKQNMQASDAAVTKQELLESLMKGNFKSHLKRSQAIVLPSNPSAEGQVGRAINSNANNSKKGNLTNQNNKILKGLNSTNNKTRVQTAKESLMSKTWEQIVKETLAPKKSSNSESKNPANIAVEALDEASKDLILTTITQELRPSNSSQKEGESALAQSEWSSKLRTLITAIRDQERTAVLKEIANEESQRKLTIIKEGMIVRRCNTSNISSNGSNNSGEINGEPKDNSSYKIGKVIKIRPLVLSVDLEYDALTQEHFVSLEHISLIPSDARPIQQGTEGSSTSDRKLSRSSTNSNGNSNGSADGEGNSGVHKLSSSPQHQRRQIQMQMQTCGNGSNRNEDSGAKIIRDFEMVRGKVISVNKSDNSVEVQFENGSKDKSIKVNNKLKVINEGQLAINDRRVRDLLDLEDSFGKGLIESLSGSESIIAGLDFEKHYPWLQKDANNNSKVNSKSNNKQSKSKKGSSAARSRHDNSNEMHAQMQSVLKAIYSVKNSSSQQAINRRIGAALLIQALARGYMCRRRLKGIRMKIMKFRANQQRERELIEQNKQLEAKLKEQMQLAARSKPTSLARNPQSPLHPHPHSQSNTHSYHSSSSHLQQQQQQQYQSNINRVGLTVNTNPAPTPTATAVSSVVAHHGKHMTGPTATNRSRDANSSPNRRPSRPSMDQQPKQQRSPLHSKPAKDEDEEEEEDEEANLGIIEVNDGPSLSIDDVSAKHSMQMSKVLQEKEELQKQIVQFQEIQSKQLEAIESYHQKEIDEKQKLQQESDLRKADASESAKQIEKIRNELALEREKLDREHLSIQQQREQLKAEIEACFVEKTELTLKLEQHRQNENQLTDLKKKLVQEESDFRAQQEQQQQLQQQQAAIQSQLLMAAEQDTLIAMNSTVDGIMQEMDQMDDIEDEICNELNSKVQQLRDRINNHFDPASFPLPVDEQESSNIVANSVASPAADAALKDVAQLMEENKRREKRLHAALKQQEQNELAVASHLQEEHNRLQSMLRQLIDDGLVSPDHHGDLLSFVDVAMMGGGLDQADESPMPLAQLEADSVHSSSVLLQGGVISFGPSLSLDNLVVGGSTNSSKLIDGQAQGQWLSTPNIMSRNSSSSLLPQKMPEELSPKSIPVATVTSATQLNIDRSDAHEVTTKEAVESTSPSPVVVELEERSLKSGDSRYSLLEHAQTMEELIEEMPVQEQVMLTIRYLQGSAHRRWAAVEAFAYTSTSEVTAHVHATMLAPSSSSSGSGSNTGSDKRLAEHEVVKVLALTVEGSPNPDDIVTITFIATADNDMDKSKTKGKGDETESNAQWQCVVSIADIMAIAHAANNADINADSDERVLKLIANPQSAVNKDASGFAFQLEANVFDFREVASICISLWEIQLSWCAQCFLMHTNMSEKIGDILLSNVQFVLDQKRDQQQQQQQQQHHQQQQLLGTSTIQSGRNTSNNTPRQSNTPRTSFTSVNITPRGNESNQQQQQQQQGQQSSALVSTYFESIEGKVGEYYELLVPLSAVSKDIFFVVEQRNDVKKIFVKGVRVAQTSALTTTSDSAAATIDVTANWTNALQQLKSGDELIAIDGTLFEGETLEAVYSFIRRRTGSKKKGNSSYSVPISQTDSLIVLRLKRYFGHNLLAHKSEIESLISSTRQLHQKYVESEELLQQRLRQFLSSFELTSYPINSDRVAESDDVIDRFCNELQSAVHYFHQFLTVLPIENMEERLLLARQLQEEQQQQQQQQQQHVGVGQSEQIQSQSQLQQQQQQQQRPKEGWPPRTPHSAAPTSADRLVANELPRQSTFNTIDTNADSAVEILEQDGYHEVAAHATSAAAEPLTLTSVTTAATSMTAKQVVLTAGNEGLGMDASIEDLGVMHVGIGEDSVEDLLLLIPAALGGPNFPIYVPQSAVSGPIPVPMPVMLSHGDVDADGLGEGEGLLGPSIDLTPSGQVVEEELVQQQLMLQQPQPYQSIEEEVTSLLSSTNELWQQSLYPILSAAFAKFVSHCIDKYVNHELVDGFSQACRLVAEQIASLIQQFDWPSWWTKRDMLFIENSVNIDEFTKVLTQLDRLMFSDYISGENAAIPNNAMSSGRSNPNPFLSLPISLIPPANTQTESAKQKNQISLQRLVEEVEIDEILDSMAGCLSASVCANMQLLTNSDLSPLVMLSTDSKDDQQPASSASEASATCGTVGIEANTIVVVQLDARDDDVDEVFVQQNLPMEPVVHAHIATTHKMEELASFITPSPPLDINQDDNSILMLPNQLVENVSMITDCSEDNFDVNIATMASASKMVQLLKQDKSSPTADEELLCVLILFFKQCVEVFGRWCVRKLVLTAQIETRLIDRVVGQILDSNGQFSSSLSQEGSGVILSANGSANGHTSGYDAGYLSVGEVLRFDRGAAMSKSAKAISSKLVTSIMQQVQGNIQGTSTSRTGAGEDEDSQSQSQSQSYYSRSSAGTWKHPHVTLSMLRAELNNAIADELKASSVSLRKFEDRIKLIKTQFLDNFQGSDNNVSNNKPNADPLSSQPNETVEEREAMHYIDGVTSSMLRSINSLFNRIFKDFSKTILFKGLSDEGHKEQLLDEGTAAQLVEECKKSFQEWDKYKAALHMMLVDFLVRFSDDIPPGLSSELEKLDSFIHTNLDQFAENILGMIQQQLFDFDWSTLWKKQLNCQCLLEDYSLLQQSMAVIQKAFNELSIFEVTYSASTSQVLSHSGSAMA